MPAEIDRAEMERAAERASAAGLLPRVGHVLFRWRSFTPVPLVLIALPLLWTSRGAPGTRAMIAVGLALCTLGQAFRCWVIGQVPDGTSGQNESLIATQLNTRGPYARTRNPLYLGNFGITLGLCFVAHSWWLIALVSALFAIQYWFIIAAEEAFLRARFGQAFDDFCARVPRFWPRLTGVTASDSVPLSVARMLRKEHNPAAAWLLISLVLIGLDRVALALRAGRSLTDVHTLSTFRILPLAIAFAVVLLAFLGVKAWKHHWFSGGFIDDLKRRRREISR